MGLHDRSELISADPANAELGTFAYQYNGLGNRETATEGNKTTAYQTNALNQYTQTQISADQRPLAVTSPQYDLDGDLISDDKAAYTWNARGG